MARRRINPGEHVLVAGRTGSGKTFLARVYLANFPARVIALDTKGLLRWPEVDPERLTVATRFSEVVRSNKERVIYKPAWEEMDWEVYELFFEWCYRQGGPLVVWIDEAMAVCPNPHTIPQYYKAILTRGREHEISAWSLTQRPSGIPQVIISEATHYFIFDLRLHQDRQKIVYATGATELWNPPGKHTAWYYHVEDDQPVKMKLVVKRGGEERAHAG